MRASNLYLLPSMLLGLMVFVIPIALELGRKARTPDTLKRKLPNSFNSFVLTQHPHNSSKCSSKFLV